MLQILFNYRSEQHRLILPWLQDRQTIIIGVDPIFNCRGYRFWWLGHQFIFNVPNGTNIQPVRLWKSKSPNSAVLFPWWWHAEPQADIVCIIVPAGGLSSRHYHKQTQESFANIFSDGETGISLDGRLAQPMIQKELAEVPPGTWHQLRRPIAAAGFSMHLLQMFGSPNRFPSRADHFFQPAAAVAVA